MHGELPPRARQRVDQHLNQCSSCAAFYVAQRQLVRDLEQTLPQIARTSTPQLNRIWADIQADMTRPRIIARPQTRYGVAALILMLALLLPWSMDKQRGALALPLQPIPAVSLTGTPVSADAVEALVEDGDNATPTAQVVAAVMTPEIRNTP